MALGWGPSFITLQEKFKSLENRDIGLYTHSLTLSDFPGDCGALFLRNANAATKKGLRTIIAIASECGYNKIFATVVGDTEYSCITDAVQAFKSTRWKLVHKGPSNRNPHKTSFVFVKIIRNPKYKGY